MRDHDALHAFLTAWSSPFDWTLHGCCIGFCAAAVKAQTGVDHLEGIAPFKTQRGAVRALRTRGGYFEAVSSRLTEIAPAFAKRGDVALVTGIGSAALMIFEGETLVGSGPDGLARLPRERAIAAWSADG